MKLRRTKIVPFLGHPIESVDSVRWWNGKEYVEEVKNYRGKDLWKI